MITLILIMLDLSRAVKVRTGCFQNLGFTGSEQLSLLRNTQQCWPRHLSKCWWRWWRQWLWQWQWQWRWWWRWDNWERLPIKLPLKAFLAKYKWSTYTTELWDISGFPKTRFFETKNIPKMSSGRFGSCQCQCQCQCQCDTLLSDAASCLWRRLSNIHKQASHFKQMIF